MMETKLISISEPNAIGQALAVLNSGGLIAFPTDTVYGVAALAFSSIGIDRIYEAKGRDAAKAIPILVGTLEQLPLVMEKMTPDAETLSARFWPGALTLVIPRHPDLPGNISQTPTIGVRMPDYSFTLELLQRSGPLAVTSANISGQANPQTAQDVLKQLGGRIELVLDGGQTLGGVPSTVVDCTSSDPKILRQGAISADEIMRALGKTR